ncbi:MAG: ABC transporter ATP-binding protein [Candidatus Zixiibacteriota bacterium]
MPGLSVNNVSKTFADSRVLDNISLELTGGELLVLLGSSGCGKSTLLRIIAGLEQADSGQIFIDGRRVDELRPRDRNIALVFQNYSLYPHMSVEKNLAFPLKVSGVKKDEIRQRVSQTAQLLGLADRLKDKPGQLSGGQRQRVALGRAIIRQPSLFLLDEPLSNLDADLRVRMRQEIVRLQKELNCTMVHVTHDQAEALTMADRIALLHCGRIEQIGTPEELYQSPVSEYVANFIGQPKINMIDGSLEGTKLMPFGLEFAGNLDKLDRTRVRFGIRPEAIAIHPEGDFTGHVVSAEYMGDHYVMVLSYRELALTVMTVATPPEPTLPVRFTIYPRDLLFFDSESGKRLELL